MLYISQEKKMTHFKQDVPKRNASRLCWDKDLIFMKNYKIKSVNNNF